MNNEYINCSIVKNKDLTLTLSGNITNTSFKKMYICASNPITPHSSYSGNALPYPSYEIAFENTKNHYNIDSSGIINTTFKYPNSYYDVTGKIKIPPTIYFHLDDKVFKYELPDLYVLKTLNDRFRSLNNGTQEPSFYAKKELLLPIDTAENTMYNISNLKFTKNIA